VEKANGAPLNIVEEPRRPGDPATLVAAADRVQKLLGWRPKYDDLDKIVSTSLAWERRIAIGDPSAYRPE
jgi:UDP-glucose 4-epimerase